MEKYCQKCGRVFDDLNFKLCPYCGSELATRYGRQPIPRKLRHEVFKRDGYRCRECGASKDETSLEIDHIVPVARGGTNDIDNLQTLCRECNRMKHTDEWVGGNETLEGAKNELDNLRITIHKLENKLEKDMANSEKLELQFRIMKMKEEIPVLHKKIKKLRAEYDKQVRNDKLYKRMYVLIGSDTLAFSEHYSLPYSNKEDLITYLVKKYTVNQVSKMIQELK